MDQFVLDGIKAWNQRKRPEFHLIRVKPINPSIGAEVSGVDLSQPISPELFAELNTAICEYQVLVFRDQTLSNENHKAFGRLFGPLHAHAVHAVRAKAKEEGNTAVFDKLTSIGITDDPEIIAVAANEASKNVAGEGWHTDATFEEAPPMGSMLYMTQVPVEGGGATLFMNTHLAYETLSPTMKTFLEGLTAIHDAAGLYAVLGTTPAPGAKTQHEHPVVVRHPVTGRKMLYVSEGFTQRIVQLAPHESRALLDMLFRHCGTTMELHCRVQWEPNTLTFWDNQATQHHAVWDYFPNRRYGQRVSILGGKPCDWGKDLCEKTSAAA